ncbi:hypothetical protein CK203_099489 [Vitis vinifera]|uniref:Transposon Ty3-I Gag-Pol polyprotein n=1 Tax=Vitis vinifera TaxID=29760 RepID=A0A438DVU6_VITVI|nr:hypothetical protein CK203_099489 [Vitis vinifera]
MREITSLSYSDHIWMFLHGLTRICRAMNYPWSNHLPLLPHVRPVKQKLRRLYPRWSLQVKEEIQKQLSMRFLSVVEYPEWLANVILVPKKDDKVRVYVDFRDLNKASPKDDFLFLTSTC